MGERKGKVHGTGRLDPKVWQWVQITARHATVVCESTRNEALGRQYRENGNMCGDKSAPLF